MLPPAASRWPLVALAVVVLFGGALRFWQARESLWLDELHTAWCALGSLAEVAPRAAIGNQSPLYFWLEWLLVQWFGASELTVRLPSLIAGSLLPVALYAVVRRWTNDVWLGVLAAWMAAVDPVQLYYATEARPYALVELLAVVHIGVLTQLLERPRLALHLALVALGAAIFHLHYTAALLFPAEALAVVLVALTSREDQPDPQLPVSVKLLPIMVDYLAIASLCLPAVPHLVAIFERRTNWELFVPRPERWDELLILPWSWTALVVLAVLAFRLWKPEQSGAAGKIRLGSILALSWLLVPLIVACALSYADIARLYFLRYTIASAPAGFVLAALAVGVVPWPRIRAGVGAVVAGVALLIPAMSAIPQLAADGRLIANRRGDWRSAIAHFNRQPDRGQYPVLVATQLIESESLRGSSDPALAEYCLYPVHSLYPIAAQAALTIPLPRTNPGQLAPAVSELVGGRGGAWLIFSGGSDAADANSQGVIESVQSPRSKVQSQGRTWSAQRESFGTVHVIQLTAPEN